MAHPLVKQLRFTRSEFMRIVEGVSEEDARRQFEPMNSISWAVGHMANQEQAFWLLIPRGLVLVQGLNDRVGTGKPRSAPSLAEMLDAWRKITASADEFLDTLDAEKMTTHMEWKGVPRPESIGTLLYRNIYHYWFHLGEVFAVRELLGHSPLPDFVGDISQAPYEPG